MDKNETNFIDTLIDFYKELFAISHNQFHMTINLNNVSHFSEKLELLEMSITHMYYEFNRNKCISIFKVLNEYKSKVVSYWKQVSQNNENLVLQYIDIAKNKKNKKNIKYYEYLYLSILKNNDLMTKENVNIKHKNNIVYIARKIAENM